MEGNHEIIKDIAERRRIKYKTKYNRTVTYLRWTVGLLVCAIVSIVWLVWK